MPEITTERLIVSNFVGINHLDITLTDINILIGPQATGKSICAKLLYYFKDFIWQMMTAVREGEDANLSKSYAERFEQYFPRKAWGVRPAFEIRYELGSEFIELSLPKRKKNSTPIIEWSAFFDESAEWLRRKTKEFTKPTAVQAMPDVFWRVQNEFCTKTAKGHAPRMTYSQMFIPAGRSFFANLRKTVFTFLANNIEIDPFLKNFGSNYENWKGFFHHLSLRAGKDRGIIANDVDRLISLILRGKYKVEKGDDILELADGRKIDVAHSSSAQQETLPLAVMLGIAPFIGSHGAGYTFYIEEPEAHLFPLAQKHIVELLATVFAAKRSGMQYIITTHSPYILTAFNNLLTAGRLAKGIGKQDLVKLNRIVPANQRIQPNQVSAYYLDGHGATSIMNQDDGLIDAQAIDAVSQDIAVQFDQLLDFQEIQP